MATNVAAVGAGRRSRLAGRSAEQLIETSDAGDGRDLDDTPESRIIAYLALLIPFGRRHA